MLTPDQSAAVQALDMHGSYRKAADALGLAPSTFQSRITAARRHALIGALGGPAIPEAAKPPYGFVITRNSSAFDKDGNLSQQHIRSERDTGPEFDVPAGHVVKGESALVDRDGKLIAKWVKTREGDAPGLADALRQTFKEFKGAAPLIEPPEHLCDDLLTVYPVPDLHFGMYAWGPEAGEDYDIEKAAAVALDGVKSLVAQSYPSRRAVVLGLGDYFHANDHKAITPRSGVRLDVDTRWPRVFAAGARLATALVDVVARKHSEIEVVFLPGNHDVDAAVCLTVALALFYEKTKRITINDGPGIAWFHRFGSVLLGATHGHTMKPDRMAMMLATDRPADWGETAHRHFFFGHIHHETAHEIGPVRVESFASPAPKDAFSAASGYRSNRALSAITYHNERGEIGRHRVTFTIPRTPL